jgi:hypothetical protein
MVKLSEQLNEVLSQFRTGMPETEPQVQAVAATR